MNKNIAIAKGEYEQDGASLIIHTEINSVHGFMIPFFVLAVFFYVVIFLGLIGSAAAENSFNEMPFFVIPMLGFHALIMFGIPYFIMRRSVKKMKYNLEREFHYLAKR